MRPSGPLPPGVYWARRLLALSLVLLLVVGVWWLLGRGRGDGPRPTAAGVTQTPGEAGSTQGSQAMLEPPQSHDTSPRSQGAGPPSRTTAPPEPGAPPNKKPDGPGGNRLETTPTTPLESPTGNCDPRQVDMSIDVADSVEGRSNTATFVFRLPAAASACTLAITPDTLVARVTSGPDIVWSSGDCPDALLAKKIVVRREPATVYAFQWNGRRSTDECRVPGTVAAPGGYWVQAALVGGEPHKAYFDITEPRSAKR